jgi:hypothetical protein
MKKSKMEYRAVINHKGCWSVLYFDFEDMLSWCAGWRAQLIIIREILLPWLKNNDPENYTRIKDIKDKKIFENDIIRCVAGECYQGINEFELLGTVEEICGGYYVTEYDENGSKDKSTSLISLSRHMSEIEIVGYRDKDGVEFFFGNNWEEIE